MSDLGDLYQELILDHNKRPRNRGRLEQCDCHARGHNPMCGDQVDIDVDIDDGVIADVSFDGSGCAISTASASIMTETVKGKTVDEAKRLFAQFHDVVTGAAPADREALGKLFAFSGVGAYPARVKCATLAWHTLIAALEGQERVSTE